jgi:glycosyltransferase involved in cell wall biosynthesis
MVLRGRLRALRESGFHVILICSPGPLLDETAAAEGVERIPVPMERKIAPWADLISLVRLWRVLRRLRPDITDFSTPKAGLLGNIAAFLCGVPVRIYTLRGLRLETARGIQRRILRVTERVAAWCAHSVVCNSESLKKQALAHGIAPKRKLKLLGDGSSNGVDVEHFCPGQDSMRVALGLPRKIPVIGFVGRLTRDKGIAELILAFDSLLEVMHARLLLVGWFDRSEDAVDPALCRYIRDHPYIVCTGYVADTAPYYRAMDVMVLPTWREGFPNVVLEAAASGVPVITTIATGARDAVLPEVTGVLIPPGDPEELRKALLRLLKSARRRREMGAAARKWVIEHFVNGRVMRLSIAFYKSLLKAQPPAKARLVAKGAEAAAD